MLAILGWVLSLILLVVGLFFLFSGEVDWFKIIMGGLIGVAVGSTVLQRQHQQERGRKHIPYDEPPPQIELRKKARVVIGELKALTSPFSWRPLLENTFLRTHHKLTKISAFFLDLRRARILAFSSLAFLGAIIWLTILGSGVEATVKDAREYVSEGKYLLAISEYKEAFEKWDGQAAYAFTRSEIESELKAAKAAYATAIAKEAQKEIVNGNLEIAKELLQKAVRYDTEARAVREAQSSYAGTLAEQALLEIKSDNLKKAEDLIDEAQNYSEDTKILVQASDQLEQALALRRSDELLDNALQSVEEGEYLKAVELVKSAGAITEGYERVSRVRAKIAPAIEAAAKEHVLKARQAIHKWDLGTAREQMEAAAELDPEVDRLDMAKREYEEAQAVIEQIGPKPENSSWDGAVRPVVLYLKEILKDPQSVEYMEWSPAVFMDLDGEKFWAVRVKYRAKNSFGGYVIEEKVAFIRHGLVFAMTNY